MLGGNGAKNAELLARALRRGDSHRGAFTQRNLYTGEALHTEVFPLRTIMQGSFYIQTRLHRAVVTQRSFYKKKFLHTDTFMSRKDFHTEQFLHSEALTQKFLRRVQFLQTEEP